MRHQLALALALLTAPSCGCAVIDAPAPPGADGGAPAMSTTGIAFPKQMPTVPPTCDPDYTCAKAIAPDGDPAKLCTSKKTAMFYTGLVWCACSASGPCRAVCVVCVQTACLDHPASEACTTCIEDATSKNGAPQGCGEDLHARTGKW